MLSLKNLRDSALNLVEIREKLIAFKAVNEIQNV